MVTERDQTLDGGYTMQCANDVLQNCAYIILLTNVTHVNAIKKIKMITPNIGRNAEKLDAYIIGGNVKLYSYYEKGY